ncbi:MAG: mandelate racemase/muconate lactonizing enzyme family protein [Chloroflexi bacterium]|nr:mandelate racemase/muconate lactonizing enzyme family protein [Chloroflexota bacterium]
MKITKVMVTPITMPKQDPTWRTAHGSSPASDGLVVQLFTDGPHTGYGYAGADAPFRGSNSAILQQVLGKLYRWVTGQNPFDMEKILTSVDSAPLEDIAGAAAIEVFRARMRAKAAIDIALHDLVAKALGIPLYQFFGGLVREEVPILRILAIKEPAEMAKSAIKLRREGYTYLKIKLEGNPAKDVERVKAVREAVGPGIHLTMDGNCSYTDPKVAIEAIKQMESYGLEVAEQPTPADDWESLAQVTRGVNCLVEAHESANTLESIFQLVHKKVASCISVSATQSGLRAMRTAADICRVGKVKFIVVCMGTHIVSAASMHFVAATSGVDYACQFGEFARFTGDPTSGLEIRNGMMRVPTGPGLGIRVNV